MSNLEWTIVIAAGVIFVGLIRGAFVIVSAIQEASSQAHERHTTLIETFGRLLEDSGSRAERLQSESQEINRFVEKAADLLGDIHKELGVLLPLLDDRLHRNIESELTSLREDTAQIAHSVGLVLDVLSPSLDEDV